MAAYYNEIDPYAAQWLRNLIDAGHIAPGDVDERSIEDVHPDDLKPYTQCHFFAGVGVWSYALRRAGWPDDRPVWTGSCPCQPFSAAGAGAGFDDQRHLWPHLHWLISERQPAVIFGEQVASKDADPWLDLVQADVEAMAYAFGAIAFPSAGVGAPHIRDRTYWVANANNLRQSLRNRSASDARRWQGSGSKAGRCSPAFWMDHANDPRLEGHAGDGSPAGRQGPKRSATETNLSGGLANLHGDRCHQAGQRGASAGNDGAIGDRSPTARIATAGPVNGLWADADWLFCRDGKWRPVEPGTFPLANGATSRVGLSGSDWRTPAGEEKSGNRAGRLRAYGNAINAEAARIFVEAYLDATDG